MGAWRRLWRRLLIALGIRRITPRDGEPRPARLVVVPDLDTGGAYRPKHRVQDPAKDPSEPYGGESSSTGNDHGWSGCTMTAGADALAYHAHYGGRELTKWGGDLRHRQGDLSGGTDLQDLRQSWAAYGEDLNIQSGAGWSKVVELHEQGRAIVIQGIGEVPGAGDFDGGHACSIGAETRASDGAWLFGDPLVTDWQWIAPAKIKTWAQAWQSSIAFAVSRKPPAPPTPPPTPPPVPPAEECYSRAELEAAEAAAAAEAASWAVLEAGDELVATWVDWFRAPAPLPADAWQRGTWADPRGAMLAAALELGDVCEPGMPSSWSRGHAPMPVADAIEVVTTLAAWGASAWRAAGWRA